MKRIVNCFLLLVLAVAPVSWMNCSNGDNPLDPGSLAGTWTLVSLTDKTVNLTLQAGVPTPIPGGGGATLTVTGSLVLTDTRYTFSFTVTTNIPGQAPQTDTEFSAGTYTINGSTLVTIEDGSGETDSLTISREGNRLTIEDNESRFVFQK